MPANPYASLQKKFKKIENKSGRAEENLDQIIMLDNVNSFSLTDLSALKNSTNEEVSSQDTKIYKTAPNLRICTCEKRSVSTEQTLSEWSDSLNSDFGYEKNKGWADVAQNPDFAE